MAIVTGLRPNRTRVKMLQDFVKTVFARAKEKTQARIAAAGQNPVQEDQALMSALATFSDECDAYYEKMDEVEAFIQKKGGDPAEYEKTLDEKLSDLSTRYGTLVGRLKDLDDYRFDSGEKVLPGQGSDLAFSNLRKGFSGCQAGDKPGLFDILYRTAQAAEVLEKERRFVDQSYVEAVNEQFDAVLTEAWQSLYAAANKMPIPDDDDAQRVEKDAILDQFESLYVRQCTQVDVLASQTNAALNTRRAHQLHQDIAVSGLHELMGEEQAKQYDPLHPEQVLYGSGGRGVGALRYLPKAGRNNMETALAALGGYGWQLPTFQFGKRKVRLPVPGVIGRFGDLPIIRSFLKPALVVRPSSSGSFTKGLEVASASWRQKGMGLLGKDREEALRLLIFTLAERLRAEAKEKGESLDMSAAELFLNCPEDLGQKAIEFAIAAGFHPKNVSAYAEKDMGYSNISEKEKAYEGQLKSFASFREEYSKDNDKKYHDAVRALESKHLGDVYEKEASGFVRPSERRDVKVRHASRAHLLGTRSSSVLPLEGEKPVRQDEESVAAREIQARPKQDFYSQPVWYQEKHFFSANPEQRLSLLSDESDLAWSLERKVAYFARLNAQEQAQILAADLHYKIENNLGKEFGFSHPVLMKECIARLDNQSAYQLYLALRLPASDLGELRSEDANKLREGLGRLMVLSMTEEQRQYTKENIAKQNLMESSSAAFSKRLVGPLGSHVREKHVAAEGGFQSGPVAWRTVESLLFKTTPSDRDLANLLDQVLAKGLDALRTGKRMNQIAEKLATYSIGAKVVLMNLMLHPEKLFERGLLSKENIRDYLSHPQLSLQAKAALLSSDPDFHIEAAWGQTDENKVAFLGLLTSRDAMIKGWEKFKTEKGNDWKIAVAMIQDPRLLEVVVENIRSKEGKSAEDCYREIFDVMPSPDAKAKWVQAVVKVGGEKAIASLLFQATDDRLAALSSVYGRMTQAQQESLLSKVANIADESVKRQAYCNLLSAWPMETESDRRTFTELLNKLPPDVLSDGLIYTSILPSFSSAWQEAMYCERAVTGNAALLQGLLKQCQHPVEVILRLNWPEEKTREALIQYVTGSLPQGGDPPSHQVYQAIEALAGHSGVDVIQDVYQRLGANAGNVYLVALFSPEKQPPLGESAVENLTAEQQAHLRRIYPDDQRFAPAPPPQRPAGP